MKRQLKLGVFVGGSRATGHHIASWRHPTSNADAAVSIEHFKRVAEVAERGKFDMMFLSDSPAVTREDPRIASRSSISCFFEPLTLLSALSAVTHRIGLVGSCTTSYSEPYNVARAYASLDHLSGGRAGWNVVTTGNPDAAQNFRAEKQLEHELRYERAEEFVAVVTGLWDSWDDDAFVRDRQSGIFFDPDKMHTLGHVGNAFSVRGPLNIARSPQGHPVIVQAGASDTGQELAAKTAEVVFTAAPTIADGQDFYRSLKGRLAKYGRTREQLVIMPGASPVVGRTAQEARDKHEELQALIDPAVGVSLLSKHLGGGVDLSHYPIDGPLPEIPATEGGQSRHKLLTDLARRDNLSIRQLYEMIAGARGHLDLVGTAETIADHLEEWFLAEAADGFNIMPPTLPGGLDDFVELVIPELQRRGLFRTEYEGTTLREHLGLRRPPNRYGAAHEKVGAGAS